MPEIEFNSRRSSLFILSNQEIVPERFITHYESVIASGHASIILEEEEIRKRLIALCNKLAPDSLERREDVINKYIKAVCIVKISVQNITGKKNEDY